MGNILWIGMGGFIGAVLRYLISGYVQDSARPNSFPHGTLVVNILGSFIIGLAFYFIESRGDINPQMKALALVGVLGAFTTFSTFSIETLNLAMAGKMPQAAMNLGANLVLGMLAVWAGRVLPGVLGR